jgi:hypothetical protein
MADTMQLLTTDRETLRLRDQRSSFDNHAGMGPVFAFCETLMNCTFIYFSIEAKSASTAWSHYTSA